MRSSRLMRGVFENFPAASRISRSFRLFPIQEVDLNTVRTSRICESAGGDRDRTKESA